MSEETVLDLGEECLGGDWPRWVERGDAYGDPVLWFCESPDHMENVLSGNYATRLKTVKNGKWCSAPLLGVFEGEVSAFPDVSLKNLEPLKGLVSVLPLLLATLGKFPSKFTELPYGGMGLVFTAGERFASLEFPAEGGFVALIRRSPKDREVWDETEIALEDAVQKISDFLNGAE